MVVYSTPEEYYERTLKPSNVSKKADQPAQCNNPTNTIVYRNDFEILKTIAIYLIVIFLALAIGLLIGYLLKK